MDTIQPPLPGLGPATKTCRRGRHVPQGRGTWKRCIRCDVLVFQLPRRRKRKP